MRSRPSIVVDAGISGAVATVGTSLAWAASGCPYRGGPAGSWKHATPGWICPGDLAAGREPTTVPGLFAGLGL
jgi:hypothetical protein